MKLRYILIGCLLFFIIYRLCLGKQIIILESKINGKGVHANQSFKKGDIIIHDMFPYKHKNRILNHPPVKDFYEISLHEVKYINHCSRNYNSAIISKDNQLFQLIATKNIQSGQEITANYGKTNQIFPFIASSEHFSENHYTC